MPSDLLTTFSDRYIIATYILAMCFIFNYSYCVVLMNSIDLNIDCRTMIHVCVRIHVSTVDHINTIVVVSLMFQSHLNNSLSCLNVDLTLRILFCKL
jgi:hypothetical protein